MIMKTKEGIVVTILVGIVGALIGGVLLSFFVDTASGGWWFTLFTAILGAVILLWLFRLVPRPQGRPAAWPTASVRRRRRLRSMRREP